MERQLVLYPHLDGDSFFWEGGEVGNLIIHGFTATTGEVRPLTNLLNNNGYTVAGPLLSGNNTTPKNLNNIHWRD
jgi:carboxylesterase